MNWQILLQAVSVAAGSAVSAYQLKSLFSRSKSDLKLDLEILKLIDSSDSNYPIVKTYIDGFVKELYGTPDGGPKKIQADWSLVIFFTILLAGFIAWTLHLIQSGSHVWYIATISVCIISLLGLVGSFGPETKQHKGDRKNHKN